MAAFDQRDELKSARETTGGRRGKTTRREIKLITGHEQHARKQ
jgi:hypothetical protein